MKAIEFIYSDKLEQNLERYEEVDGEKCECCGKPLKSKKYYVNTIDGPFVVEPHITDEEMRANGTQSQGIFYLGSSCIKKYPKSHIGKL